MRKFTMGKYGPKENPVGHHVTWSVRDRAFIAEVTGFYRHDVRGVTLLQTRFLNGEKGPDVGITVVNVLERNTEAEGIQ